LSDTHEGSIRSVLYTNSDEIISGGSDGKIVRWKQDGSSQILANASSGVRAIAISPDQQFLCYADNDSTLHLYALSSGKHREIHAGISHIIQTGFIDDKTLAVLNSRGTLEIVSERDRSLVLNSPSSTKIKCFAINRESTLLAAGFEDGSITIWKVSSPGSPLNSFDSARSPIMTLSFAPNGDVAYGTESGVLCIWNFNHPNPPTLTTNGLPIRSITYSPDGKLLAAGSSDGKVRIWNPERLGDLPLSVSLDGTWVWSLAFNQNSSELAVASKDHTIYRIPTYSSKLVQQISPHLKRNLSQKEWDEYIGHDITYMKTLPDLSSSSE
jgi:WD40 repeat protein